jgi:hypothetical protein
MLKLNFMSVRKKYTYDNEGRLVEVQEWTEPTGNPNNENGCCGAIFLIFVLFILYKMCT